MLDKRNKRLLILTDIAYIAIILIIVYFCFGLFTNMIAKADGFGSDIPYYVNRARQPETGNYRLPFALFKLLLAIDGTTKPIAIYLAVQIGLIFVANYLFIKLYSPNDTARAGNRAVVALLSIATVFAYPIYVPRIHPAFYKNTFNCFAWHSPTQQAMTLFAVLGMLSMLMMFRKYEEKINFWWWLGTAVFCFLSAYAKPSFIIDFVPAIVVAFLIELFSKTALGFGEKFKRLFIMGCSLVPSGVYMLALNYIIYRRQNRIGDGEVLLDSARIEGFEHLWVYIFCGWAFAMIVLVFNWKKIIKDRKYQIIILTALCGLAQWGMLAESGRRANHGNFAWGKIIGGYMLLIAGVSIAVENYRDKSFLSKAPWLRVLYFLMLAGSFGLHVLSGAYYFVTLCMGHGFWR